MNAIATHKVYIDAFEDKEDISSLVAMDDHEEAVDACPVSAPVYDEYSDDDGYDDADVEYVTDEEYGNDDDADHVVDECPEEDEEIRKALRLKYLRDFYQADLDRCGDVLEGKLKWVDCQSTQQPAEFIDPAEYPSVADAVTTRNLSPSADAKEECSIKWNEFRDSAIPVKSTTVGRSRINFKRVEPVPPPVVPVIKDDRLCKYIRAGETCRFGDRCRFTHVTKKPRCKKGPSCVNKKCTFFHPTSEKPPRSPPVNAQPAKQQVAALSGAAGEEGQLRRSPRQPVRTSAAPPQSKKIFYCKNLIRNGQCTFGNKCTFAHSVEEVRAHAVQCKFGEKCKNIERAPDKQQYRNTGTVRCTRLHPAETVGSFIKRMQ